MPASRAEIMEKARSAITPEQRRANGAKGGSRRTSPDRLISNLALALPDLTGEQRRRLIALARVAEAIEASSHDAA